jgi:putative methionine-R-sulfoxide reductase with GAF domain
VNELNQQIIRVLKLGGPPEVVLEEVLRVALRHFRSESGTIHQLDTENQLLHLVAQIGLPPQMLQVVKTIPVGKGIAGQVVAQNQSITICNLQTEAGGVARPGARQTGVGGALCVPTRAGDKITGTLGIGTLRPYEFSPAETRELEEIGRAIGDFLKG